ncbi:uncharacterized protein LOC126391838 isoform X2 [Epinephelus moara]|nr:uncharacterized protein LOC126391838 isoform X2 [Epinephelus moara]
MGSARPCSSVFRDDLARMTSAFIYRCPGQRVLAVLVDPTNTSLGDRTPLHVLPAMSASPYPFRWGMHCALTPRPNGLARLHSQHQLEIPGKTQTPVTACLLTDTDIIYCEPLCGVSPISVAAAPGIQLYLLTFHCSVPPWP